MEDSINELIQLSVTVTDLGRQLTELSVSLHTREAQIGRDKATFSTALLEIRALSVECQMLQFADSQQRMLFITKSVAHAIISHHLQRVPDNKLCECGRDGSLEAIALVLSHRLRCLEER